MVVVTMVVEEAAEDISDELVIASDDSVLMSDESDGCVVVTDTSWSVELGVYALMGFVELALLCDPIKIPTTIPFRPGMGACGASFR